MVRLPAPARTDVDGFIESVRARAQRRGGVVEDVQQKGWRPVSDKGPLFPILKQVSHELVRERRDDSIAVTRHHRRALLPCPRGNGIWLVSARAEARATRDVARS
jgi:hypothetical protein